MFCCLKVYSELLNRFTSSVKPANCLRPRPSSVVTEPADMCISKSGQSSEILAYFVFTKATPSTPPNDVNGPNN